MNCPFCHSDNAEISDKRLIQSNPEVFTGTITCKRCGKSYNGMAIGMGEGGQSNISKTWREFK